MAASRWQPRASPVQPAQSHDRAPEDVLGVVGHSLGSSTTAGPRTGVPVDRAATRAPWLRRSRRPGRRGVSPADHSPLASISASAPLSPAGHVDPRGPGWSPRPGSPPDRRWRRAPPGPPDGTRGSTCSARGAHPRLGCRRSRPTLDGVARCHPAVAGRARTGLLAGVANDTSEEISGSAGSRRNAGNRHPDAWYRHRQRRHRGTTASSRIARMTNTSRSTRHAWQEAVP